MTGPQDVVDWSREHLDALGVEAVRRFLAGPDAGEWFGRPHEALLPDQVAPAARSRGQAWDALDLAAVALRVTSGVAWRRIGARYFIATETVALPPSVIGLPTATGTPFSGSSYAEPVRRIATRLAGDVGVSGNDLAPNHERSLTMAKLARWWGVSDSLFGATVGDAAKRFHAGELVDLGTRDGRTFYRVVGDTAPLRAEPDVRRLLRRSAGRQVMDGIVVSSLSDDTVELLVNGQAVEVDVADVVRGGDGTAGVLHDLLPGASRDSPTDLDVVATARLEQAALRRALLGGAPDAACAVCTRVFPAPLLVAAHIKPRAVCTDEERRDPNVGMLACKFGCDDMFELGQIAVDSTGRIVPGAEQLTSSGHAAKFVQVLTGRRCPAHGPATEPYFRWHRYEVAGLPE